jgi:hypothetical protein
MNGGVEVASTNSCEGRSSTTAVLVVMAIFGHLLAASGRRAAHTAACSVAHDRA